MEKIGTRDRFGLVFLLLSTSFLLSAFVSGRPGQAIPLVLYLVALAVLLRPARLNGPRWRVPGWILLSGGVGSVVARVVTHERIISGVATLWFAALLIFSITTVLWRVARAKVVTLETIYGALSGYLLIGFTYAALLASIGHFQHGPLFAQDQPANQSTIQYFAFVTMTTTGYGDFVPVSEPARTLAVADALTGQIFLVTLVARLVSILGTSRSGD